jgi:hypothetical protein
MPAGYFPILFVGKGNSKDCYGYRRKSFLGFEEFRLFTKIIWRNYMRHVLENVKN